jgi:predicted nucleotidyltransferase component of viral defense system
MISKSAIQKFADKYQTSELNVRREYFQHLFLSLFYQQKDMDKVYFKGGTALRLVYNSPRFSEDLDFDSPLPNIGAIENAVVATLSEAQRDGIDTDLDEAKETTGGYLATMRFIAADEVVPLRIEISFRDKKKKGDIFMVKSDLFQDYAITCLSQEQLVDGKISALLARRKPRDFYDFYFLLRHSMLPNNVNKKELFHNVLDALHTSDPSFDTELKGFLPKSQHMIIRDFKTTLEREIKRYV